MQTVLQQISRLLERVTGLPEGLRDDLLRTFGLLLLVWLIRFFILKVALRRNLEPTQRYQWVRISLYVAVSFFILGCGLIWIQGIDPLLTYLGLLSAGLAIALQDLLKNLAGWLFIIIRRPFSLGDRVQIGNHAGDVIDIRIFQFTLLEVGNWVQADQSTGRMIHIPNSRVFTEAQSNYYQGFSYVWSELPVLVTFESDWKRAKRILREVAERHATHLSEAAARRVREASSHYMIFYNVLTPTVYTSVEASGVLLTMRYLTEPRRRRLVDEQMWESVLEEFGAEPNIDFAYPTQRFFNHSTEGKTTKSDPKP